MNDSKLINFIFVIPTDDLNLKISFTRFISIFMNVEVGKFILSPQIYLYFCRNVTKHFKTGIIIFI